MPLRNFNPKLTDEARQAVSEAFDAISSWHTEMASTSEKVTEKVANAARALGWPEQIVGAVSTQVQGVTKMQIQMMDHFMDAWQEQIKSPNPMANFPAVMMSKLQSWPGLPSAANWPGAEAFEKMSANPIELWRQMGEEWQKNWAQAMTFWAEAGMPKGFFGIGRR